MGRGVKQVVGQGQNKAMPKPSVRAKGKSKTERIIN
jgi:hypothetical protein